MLNLTDIVLVLSSLIHFLLAVYIFTQNPKNQLNRYFSIFVFLTGVWVFSNFMIDFTANDISWSLLWARTSAVAISVLPTALLLFSNLFRDGEKRLSFWHETAISLPSVILVVLSFSDLVISNVDTSVFPVEVERGYAYTILLLYLATYLYIGIGNFIHSYRSSHGIPKQQIKFLMLGLITTVFFSLFTNLLMPIVFSNNSLVRVGPISTLFLTLCTSYAIARHRLLDVRLAIKAVIAKILVLLVLMLVIYILLIPKNENYVLTSLLISFLVVIFFNFISQFIKKLTDSFLFQKEYSRRELVRSLGKIMAESIDLAEVEENIQNTLHEIMRVDFVRFRLFAQEDNKNDLLREQVTSSPELYIYDELVREIAQMKDTAVKKRLETVKDYMAAQEIAVVVPLTATGGVIGAILLGEKKGRDAFTTTDVEILETLMYQAGVAIENAALFEETRQFNKKLQQEITIATRDLQMRNRRLSVLRKLDNIILNTPNLHEMTQKITDLVSWEMGFVGALMVLIRRYNDKEYLEAASVSSTPLFEKVIRMLPMHLTDYKVEFGADPSNLIYRAIRERRPFYTQKIADLYVPPLPHKIAEMIQRVLRIEHHMVYPLSAKGKPLGAIVIGLPKPPDQITHDEEELIQSFLDETGLAIENVLLNEELRDRNEDLRNANNRLRELDKMKDELVSIASHELRTPMTAIKSYLWMALNKEKANLNDNLRKYLDRAFVSSDRMIDLVNDMLSASRLEGNRLELHIDALDIRPLISDVIFQLTPKAEEKGLKLNFQEAKGEMPHVLADPERFNEIMMNLVGNALKYTDTGIVDVLVRVEDNRAPHNDSKGSFVWILIKDTGRGINKDDMPRLFKKFGKLEQGSFTKSAETGGTGLGLYITKGLVLLHGGDIWVDSKPEKGSTFGFSLPIGN